MPGKLILVRHGQSIWNQENLFTGWTDVDISEQGRAEAKSAGQEILREKLAIDCAFTSVLKRAIRTLWIILDETDRMWIPVERSWRLNERHYGAPGRALGASFAKSTRATLSPRSVNALATTWPSAPKPPVTITDSAILASRTRAKENPAPALARAGTGSTVQMNFEIRAGRACVRRNLPCSRQLPRH